MEQYIVFDYKPSRKSKINLVVFTVLAIFPICWGTLIITFPLMLLSEEFFSLRLPSITPYFIFFLLIVLMVFESFRTRLRKLTITTEEFSWKTSLGKHHSVKRDNITAIEWKHNQLILNQKRRWSSFGPNAQAKAKNSQSFLLVASRLCVSHLPTWTKRRPSPQKLKIYISSFPKKEKILFVKVLLNWLPDDVLNFDDLQVRNNKAEYLPNKGCSDQSICAESNKRKNSIIRRLAIAFSIVLIPLGFFVFIIEQEAGRIFLFLSGVILIIFFAAWVNTSYQAIQIDNNGITYQRGRKSHTYNWQNIEAIAVELRYRQFLIWENNKEGKLSYSHINSTFR